MRVTLRDLAFVAAAAVLAAASAFAGAPLVARGGLWRSSAAPVAALVVFALAERVLLRPLARGLGLTWPAHGWRILAGAAVASAAAVLARRSPWAAALPPAVWAAAYVLVIVTAYALFLTALAWLPDRADAAADAVARRWPALRRRRGPISVRGHRPPPPPARRDA